MAAAMPQRKRGLLLPEVDRLHVGQVHLAVYDGEPHVRELLRHRLDRRRLGEADRDDDGGPAVGELAHDLLPLRRVLDLELPDRDARLLLEALHASLADWLNERSNLPPKS
jgi:hypothetical protein